MAAGSSQTFLLLAVLVLGLFADPCESQELRCQCIQTHSDFIPSKSISNVQLIPAGAYCSRKEIIITRTDGKLICLDPEAEWVTTVIGEILDRPTLKNKKEVCLDPEAPLIKKIIQKTLSSASN